MDKILKDSRFAKIGSDKRFMTVSKKHSKVKIDKRFKSMFEDERFVSKCAVDKRGRPTNYTSKENYKKYYHLKDSDESDSESETEDKIENTTNKIESDQDSTIGSFSKTPEVQTATSEDDEDDDQSDNDSDQSKGEDKDEENVSQSTSHQFDPKVKSKLRDMSVDYARGEAALYSSDEDSSSDEESSDDEAEDTVEVFDKWGELDKDAETTEDITKRLAVCNMNWDRVKAEDIFLVMSSFCQGGGSVKAVRIYMSDFGKERIADEEKLGPKELRGAAADNDDDDEGEGELVGEIDEKMTESMALSRVRQYQINKLKYYYAVVDFDSPDTANTVYVECDGKEYELSASRFDLRFVPDDMEFEGEPSSSCLTPPAPESYKPKLFFTTALQQQKVDLTWDENDPERAAAMRKAYECEDGDIGDVKAFLASDSDDDDEISKKESRIAPPSEEDSDEEEVEDKDTIAKYRALIADINESEERKSNAKGNMEVSWDENATADEPKDDEETEQLTPWEKYLKKKKDKKTKKREKKNTSEEKENEISDDELPDGVDLNDPFFAEELGKSTKKEKKVKEKKKSNVVPDEDPTTPNALDLIVMDSDDDKNHFDFKQIRETENKDASKSKKKKWSKKKKKVEESSKPTKREDNFQVNVKDDRFSALYSTASYNIDPSDPSFKRTNAMDDLINEKQKRRKENKSDIVVQNLSKKSKLDPELSQSLKSVKTKWEKNAKRKRNTFVVKDI